MSNYGVTTKNSKKKKKPLLFPYIYRNMSAQIENKKKTLVLCRWFVKFYSFILQWITVSVSLSYFGNVSFCQGQIDLSQPNHLINHLIFPRDTLFSRIYHVSSVSNSVSYACLPSHHQLCLPIIVYHLEPLHRVLPPHQHHRVPPHPLSSSPFTTIQHLRLCLSS